MWRMVLLFAVAVLPTLAQTSASDFRQARWGITKVQVETVEGKPAYEKPGLLGYEGRLGTLHCAILYYLIDDKLVQAAYRITEKHTNENGYLEDYSELQQSLADKYGKPAQDRTVWKNDLYRDDPSHYGMAVSVGHLVKGTTWLTDRSEIMLALWGDNFDITLLIQYKSRALGHLIDEADKAKLKDAL
jgi:hypothetical protein